MADGAPFHYYFTALWLSGQWERAVTLLATKGAVADAVHIAVLAKFKGLLKLAKSDQPLRLSFLSAFLSVQIDEARPTDCSLNYARLLGGYLKVSLSERA